MQGSWVQSQMGTKLLKDSNGYKYRVNRINADDTMYYRCVKRASLKCSATAHVLVNSDPPTISRLTGEHLHGADLITDYVSFNSSWTDSLTRRPSLYEVLGGFKRKEAVSELELREECLAVGVNSVTDNSSRNRRRSEQRPDLKKLCQSFEAMSARSYMDSIIPFLSQG